MLGTLMKDKSRVFVFCFLWHAQNGINFDRVWLCVVALNFLQFGKLSMLSLTRSLACLQETVIGVGGVTILICNILCHLIKYLLGFRGLAVRYNIIIQFSMAFSIQIFLDLQDFGEGLLHRSTGIAIPLATLVDL